LRASDIAARLGGDEFVVFLPETTAEDAATLMERLRAALEAAGTLKSVEVTASVGVVVDDPSTMELEELLKRADVEMYRVKTDTKNRVGINQYPIRSSTIG
jgi:diguanylate cyclase (GGDEF)-like protein